MARRERPLSTAHEALRSAFKDMGLTDQARRLALLAAWERAVGEEIAARAEPFGFSRGVLTVKVGSAAWQQELTLLAPKLIAKLNHEVGKNIVKQIRCVAGSIERRRARERPAWLDAPTERIDADAAAELSQPIADPEVRAAFQRLLLLERKKRRARGDK